MINQWRICFTRSCLDSCHIFRQGSWMWMWALIGHQKGAVTSCIPPPRRSPSPAAPALVSSPSAPVCISARWSASDEPSVGSYLVQGEADQETERSRPRRTDKERDTEAEVWRDKVRFQLGEDSNLGLKLHRLLFSKQVSCCHFGQMSKNVRRQYCD